MYSERQRSETHRRQVGSGSTSGRDRSVGCRKRHLLVADLEGVGKRRTGSLLVVVIGKEARVCWRVITLIRVAAACQATLGSASVVAKDSDADLGVGGRQRKSSSSLDNVLEQTEGQQGEVRRERESASIRRTDVADSSAMDKTIFQWSACVTSHGVSARRGGRDNGKTDLNVDVFVRAILALVSERVTVKVDLGVVVRVLLLVHVRGEDPQSHVVQSLLVKVAR